MMHRDVLSSQEAILQLLLALLSLTTVFGMGTGVTSVPSSRHDNVSMSLTKNNIILKPQICQHFHTNMTNKEFSIYLTYKKRLKSKEL